MNGALLDAIAEVAPRRTEHAVLLDQTGRVVWRGSNYREDVVATPVMGHDIVVVHNHPGQQLAAFSVEDVVHAVQLNEAGIVAVAEQGWIGIFRIGASWGGSPLARYMVEEWAAGRATPPIDTLAHLLGARIERGPVTVSV